MPARLIGKILAYSTDANAGIIITPDLHKYVFESKQWWATRAPAAEESVTFLPHMNQAYEVRLFGVTQPSQSIFGLLKNAKENKEC